MQRIIISLAILWALPWTLLGLMLGLLGFVSGGGAQRRGRVLEFYGGAIQKLLGHAPVVRGAAAITFGHVVLAQTREELDRCRDHELVHVRQYERWGVFFIPAYVLCSLILWARGKHPYRDNPFEIEAYRS